MLHQIGAGIISNKRAVKTEACTIQLGFGILCYCKVILLLADMALIRILRNLKGRSALRIIIQNGIHIKYDLVFFIQMQVQFGRIPNDLPSGTCWELLRIRRHFHSLN